MAMMVMREVMQPVEDELADDDGWLERVIREGCPFFCGDGESILLVGDGISAGKKRFLLGRKVNLCWGGRECPSGGGNALSGGRECPSVGREISVGEIGIPRTPAGRVSGRGSWGVRGQKGV